MSDDTSNPVFNLTTDNLQLNVLSYRLFYRFFLTQGSLVILSGAD